MKSNRKPTPSFKCGICGRIKRFDAANRIVWCPACDYDIPGLSPAYPDNQAPDKEG